MFISVVVPTRNRLELLRKTIFSLQNQDYPKDAYEIIVVDDASCDGTDSFLAKLKEKNIRYFRQAHLGPAKARNLGIKNSQGQIVAFTDDDCSIPQDWLSEIASSFTDPEVLGVEGRTDTVETMVSAFTCQFINPAGKLHSYSTSNIAYRKTTLEKVGGFSDSFKYPHNEDVDLAWRVEELGRINFNTSLVVVHPPREEKFLNKTLRLRRFVCEFILYNRHPRKYLGLRNATPWKFIYCYLTSSRAQGLWRKEAFLWKRKNESLAKVVLFQIVRAFFIIFLIPWFYLNKNKS